MFGGELYSRRIANRVVFERNRIRPPLGHCARLQTSLRNWDFRRVGKRINSPSFSLNQGKPLTSNPAFVSESQRNADLPETVSLGWRDERSLVFCPAAVRTSNELAKTESAERSRRP